VPHLPFAFCHLNFELLFEDKQINWQMAKFKWQKWGPGEGTASHSSPFQPVLHLPFAFCHLNFEILFQEKQVKWQMAKVK
jgi:hypothetical protein